MLHHTGKNSAFFDALCRETFIPLSVSWMLGLAFGLYFVLLTDDLISDLLYSASCYRISIVGMFLVIFLPIVISLIAAYFSAHFLIYLLCFCKAVSFSLVLCGIAVTFGHSGWLIRSLLLFSGSAAVIPLLWFWHNLLTPGCCSAKRDFLICTAIAAAISAVDYFLVSPYLAMLMNYS